MKDIRIINKRQNKNNIKLLAKSKINKKIITFCLEQVFHNFKTARKKIKNMYIILYMEKKHQKQNQ